MQFSHPFLFLPGDGSFSYTFAHHCLPFFTYKMCSSQYLFSSRWQKSISHWFKPRRNFMSHDRKGQGCSLFQSKWELNIQIMSLGICFIPWFWFFFSVGFILWRWWFRHQVVSDSCDPMDCSLPHSSVHGISQARILEWVAMPSSKGSSWSRDRTRVSCIDRQIVYH